MSKDADSNSINSEHSDSRATESDPSDSSAPDSSAPDSSAPDSSAPDSEAPESKTPDSINSDSINSESRVPDSRAPESRASESSAPDSSAPESKAPASEADGEEAPKAPTLTRPPSVKTFVEADYPEERLAAKEGAEVILLITIKADGSTSDVEVSRSAGEGREDFDQAAVSALERFEFFPAELDHVPAAVRLEYRYVFEPREIPVDAEGDAPEEAPVNLSGTILQRGTRDPVVGALILLSESGLSAESDENGNFEIRGAPLGQVKIDIVEGGHRSLSLVEEIREGELTELRAWMWKTLDDGLTATVRGERVKREASRRTLVKEELTTVPGTFGDPLRVVQNMPGMARAPYGMGTLLVRGSSPQDTSVLIDGVPIPLLYHFAGGPSVLNPAFINTIDFYPGAYSARYGRAIAGVIDVTTKGATPTALHGHVDIDIFDTGFHLETPLSKTRNLGAIGIAGRRSYVDLLLPPLLDLVRPPGMSVLVAAPRYWDYQARYDLDRGGHQFEVLLFGSNDLMTVAQSGTPESQGFTLNTQSGFHRLRGKWGTKAGKWNLHLAPSIGLTSQNGGLSEELSVDIFSWDGNLRGAASRDFGKLLRLESGLDLNIRRYQVLLDIPGIPDYRPFPGDFPITENEKRELVAWLNTWAAYTELVISPLQGMQIIPGLRLELYDLPRGLTPSLEPRLTIRQTLWEHTTFKGAFGWFRQAPQPLQLEETFGNPDLGLLSSRQLVLGVEQRLMPKLTLDVQGFFNWRRQLVVQSDEVVERYGKTVSERLKNEGRGQSYGLELLLKQELTSRMFGWVAYTLSRSEQYNPDHKKYLPTSFDQNHILTLVASYKLNGGWELGTRFRLTSGVPETPVLGADFDADTGGYRQIQGEPGSIRGSTFHQLDFRVEKEWTFKLWRMSAYLDIQNIYNAENPELVLWDYRYRQSEPMRGIPFLPTLGLTGSF